MLNTRSYMLLAPVALPAEDETCEFILLLLLLLLLLVLFVFVFVLVLVDGSGVEEDEIGVKLYMLFTTWNPPPVVGVLLLLLLLLLVLPVVITVLACLRSLLVAMSIRTSLIYE